MVDPLTPLPPLEQLAEHAVECPPPAAMGPDSRVEVGEVQAAAEIGDVPHLLVAEPDPRDRVRGEVAARAVVVVAEVGVDELDVVRPMRRAMEANPRLLVFAACGYYDLICPPAANEWVRGQLPAPLRERARVAGHHGAHATYPDREARVRLKADGFAFLNGRRP